MPYSEKWKRERASRDHYLRNTEEMKERARSSKKMQVAVLGGYVRRVKEVPCTECGREFPHYVMDFDHVRGKSART